MGALLSTGKISSDVLTASSSLAAMRLDSAFRFVARGGVALSGIFLYCLAALVSISTLP